MYILPGMVDWQAKHNPDRLCAIWPSPNSPSGTNGVTFAEFSEATHRVAHALRPNRQGKEGEVVGLLIHTDSILYMAVVAGMIRAGLVVSRSPSLRLQRFICIYVADPDVTTQFSISGHQPA